MYDFAYKHDDNNITHRKRLYSFIVGWREAKEFHKGVCPMFRNKEMCPIYLDVIRLMYIYTWYLICRLSFTVKFGIL